MKTFITPEIAEAYLANNSKNRNINKANLYFLIAELENGRFKYNGESIIISKNGNLLDGQHRLMAIAKSKIGAYINVVTDVEDSSMPTIDTGANRTSGNVFAINGVSNANAIASMTKRIMDKMNTQRKLCSVGSLKISNNELLEFFFSNEKIIYSMFRFCERLYQKNIKFIPPAESAAYLYLFSLEDKKAKNFIRELLTGHQESESNAALKLRDKLINDKISTLKMSSKSKRNLIIYCFRKYIEEKQIGSFTGVSDLLFMQGDIRELLSKLSEDDF